MKVVNKRILLFIFGCISARLLLIVITKNIPLKNLPYLSPLFLTMGLGFLYYFLSKKDKGFTFDQKAWWQFLRPIHSILYIVTAYLAYSKNRKSYLVLTLDLFIGIVFFILHHTQK
tara:strand:- start:343 stop:690 length:348 start_codon:yes stop_codon:yes gene_type:complete